MGKKQAYNEGVASGIKVAQKVIEREVEAMNYIKSKIDLIVEGHDEMSAVVNQLIDDANENAIARIFEICNETMPRDLVDHEKIVMLDILATLSSVGLNDRQRKYYNNLRHHLNIQGYKPNANFDFEKIESLESVRAIKVIAKAVRIFLYLQECNMDGIYRHEEDLFSHFELRSFGEIDAQIELLACLFGEDGLIEIYGDFGETGKSKEKDAKYINVPEKEYLDIDNECAQIYFNDRLYYDENLQYIESSSYVLYSNGDNIMRLDKRTKRNDVLLDHIENAADFIRKRKITTFSDMGYYVLGNDLYFVDLDSLESGFIFHINEEKVRYSGETNDIDEIYEVTGLRIYKSQKLIYKNGSDYIVDLSEGMTSARRLHLAEYVGLSSPEDYIPSDVKGKYFLRGDHLYFIDRLIDLDDLNHTKYVLKRYGIVSGQVTIVSRPFGRHNSDTIYDLIAEGIWDKYYYCIFASYIGIESTDPVSLNCFYIDRHSGEIHNFYIWNVHIYQIEQHKANLIYINADKGFSLTSHNFISDKKKILVKKCGKTEKSTFSERLWLGKSEFQKTDKYMRLGKWIWTRKTGQLTPQIIPIS